MPVSAESQLPLLWRACLAGDDQLMSGLMDKGMDPRQTDRNGENCMHMAARSGEVKALEMLIHKGLDLDSLNHNGQTPLHIAVTKDQLAMVKAIVQNGADANLITKFSGMTALHIACKDNNVETVQFLIDSGANCAIKDKIGRWPDSYTKNSKILSIFDQHFDHCTHGRRKGQTTQGSSLYTESSLTTGSADSGDDNENEKWRAKQSGNTERDGQGYGKIQHGDVEIYDKMEKYDAQGTKHNQEMNKHDAKKFKINHGIGFSDEHKKRMQQNVFDRLMGGSKKKS